MSKSDNIKIVFGGGQTSANAAQPRVLSGGFFLLERTGDDSAPGVKADFIYTGALKNSEETIYLFDENCRFQDIVAAGSDWPAGDNSSKRTMERRQDFDWQTSANVGGTPKTGNSSGYVEYSGGGAAPPPSPPEPTPTYLKILISEIQIGSASGTDDEFIELYNPNEEEVNLSNWSIQKTYCNSTTVYKKNFEAENKIPAKGYFLIVYASSTDQNLLNLADMTHKTFSLTENNTIYLVVNQEKIENASDIEITDMVGFGIDIIEFRSLPAEGNSSALNPSGDKSIGRKWSTTTESYVDTDNNQNDFEIQEPTPKIKNQSPESAANELPVAQFSYVPENPIINQEILFDTSSSTDPDGQIISFIWDFGDENYTTTNQATTTHSYSTSSEFLVRLVVQDNQGATSSATTTLTIGERLTLSVVINEIAWMGTKASSTDEWIELYNDTTSSIDLVGWTLSADDGVPSITFSTLSGTTIIPALGFYLLERTNNQTVSDISADQIYTGALENEGEKLELRDSQGDLIDLVDFSVGWPAGKNENLGTSENPDWLRVSMERINPRTSGSDSINWANNNQTIRNGLDAEDNSINGTSKAQNSDYQSLPPNSVSDLALDSQNSSNNKAVLTWSSSTDPDTLSENLSYKIYYSKEGEITEGNLTASTTLSAATSAASVLISDLYYNSTYYFGVKVFDGQNYSSLSNVVSFSIPSALIGAPWTMFGGNFQRNNQSQYLGPTSATATSWTYDENVSSQNPDLNPLYTSPIIRPEGTIFSSVIYPVAKQGILALNSDGSKKSFQQTTIDKSLILQADGSVLADDGKTKDEGENTYLVEGNVLKKVGGQGNIIWQRSFEFENPYSCSTSTPAATSPAIGENGIIYLAVKNNSCNQNGDSVDYLYLLSAENEILEAVNLSGYRSSLPSVSSSGAAYIFNLIYGVGPPKLYLNIVSATGTILRMKQVASSYSSWPPSPVLIDSQENLYFVVGKDVFSWDKNGDELWKVYLGESTPANWYVGDIGIVLNNDGALYLSGRGAILGLK